ncbi:MAG: HEAT repeat domain-containing protein [Chlamydiia bacterium]|nr:HEAT repeat domain-containing protein [Chlamydiia bacterium]
MRWNGYILFPGLLFILNLCALTESDGIRRIQSHLLIDDSAAALEEAQKLVEEHPDSRAAGTSFVEALAAARREEEALAVWHRLSLQYPDLVMDRHVLEQLSWGVLQQGLHSTQNGVRLAALIGAYLTHDVRAVPILCAMLRDSNAVIRSVAAQMAVAYQDAPLREEIARMISEEKIWVVRLEVIKAAGALKMKSLAPKLQAIVQSDKATYEERQLAIEALLNIYEEMSLQQFTELARSNRAGIRHLACVLASHFELKEAGDEILKLVHDSHPDVRIAALNALGLSYRKNLPSTVVMEALPSVLDDTYPAAAITAGWVAMLVDPSLGRAHLEKWFNDPLAENRRLAASALAATGKSGVGLSLKILKESSDRYVKANLVMGLLGQREEVKMCCDVIYDFLQEEKRLWMWDTRPNPLFQVLVPSQIRYVDHIPNYPEAIDQLTRLNLVSLLAIVDDGRALEALKGFLQKRTWGITGVAAATLLQEGDDSALGVVRQLLHETDPDVQLQACLVLAMLGREESVLDDLQGAYAGANHERKMHILEALGRVGGSKSFSFLIGVFHEPFPILRVAAAAALIQCLNR